MGSVDSVNVRLGVGRGIYVVFPYGKNGLICHFGEKGEGVVT